jgi:type I restriction enzyme S subunit
VMITKTRRTTEEIVAGAWPFAASPMLPTIPTRSGWRWHRLNEVARLATGHTPSRSHTDFWGGDIPWIQLADIRALDSQVALSTSESVNELGIRNSAAVLLPKGTVCMSRTASVGFVTVMGRPMATSQDFVNWVCSQDVDPFFLMYLLIACRKPIRKLAKGSVHDTIYFPKVKSFSVCLPDEPEQRRVAVLLRDKLETVERAREAIQAQKEALEALPTALLRDTFGGEG